MSKLLRFVHHCIQDLFIADGEDFCDGSNQLKNCLPDSLADCQFMTVFPRLSEEFSDSLVVHESLYQGKDIILECHKRCACDLSRKVSRLTFAQSEQPLALLEDDLQGPASGVDFVCLEEAQGKVCGEHSAPRPSLATTYEEDTDCRICEDDIRTHIPASELSAILLLTPFVQLPDDGRSREILALETVLGLTFLTYLYHSDIVTFDMARADEADYFGTCKPTVCQHITEADSVLDCPANHLNGEVYLAHGILLKTRLYGGVFIPLLAISSGKFLLAHAVVALTAFLAKDGEVEKHLADTICDAKEEGLEAEDAVVLQMRVDTSDVLHTAACLGKVRIIYHQASVLTLVVAAHPDLRPKLADEVIHQFAPVDAPIVEEIIEHIFATSELAA